MGKKFRMIQVGVSHEHALGKYCTLKYMKDSVDLIGVVDDREFARTPHFVKADEFESYKDEREKDDCSKDESEETTVWNGVMDVIYLSAGQWHIVDYKTYADGKDLDKKYRAHLSAYSKAFKATTGEDADAKTYHIDIGLIFDEGFHLNLPMSNLSIRRMNVRSLIFGECPECLSVE
jgi:ATP-dependent exoDNAse (exonuclease V) beta subunit